MASLFPTGVSYATAEDIAAVRDLSERETEIATYLVGYASAFLRSRVTNLVTWLNSGLLEPDVARLAVIEMVLPVLINKERVSSETTGPLTVRYAESLASGIDVTDRIVGMVTPGGAAAVTKRRLIGSLNVRSVL